MCGIAGFIQYGSKRYDLSEVLRDMSLAIQHRGPDDHGVWFDADAGIGLAHQRLSVLDISPEGHQPMVSHTGRYVLVYNGEVYNYKEIRKELEKNDLAPSWRGHSDTEVLLAAFEAWGVEASLERIIAMFAFALWDVKTRRLTLARDRLGEKPLYYGWQGKAFLFGSELKALQAHPCFHNKIDRDVLALFMRHNYIPAPYSIFSGIKKLAPGSFIQFAPDIIPGELSPVKKYWQLRTIVEDGVHDPFQGTDEEAVDALDHLLRETVQDKMIADVPLGAFLSGGIDSSTVVAIMQAVSNTPVRTFSIGFHEKTYNEAVHARAVADYLRTEHTELYVTPEQAMDVIPHLPALYDEPFSDSSQIPTYLVSKMTRQHVTVALSGDGGDELFGGYNRYFLGCSIWNKIGWMPAVLRKLAVGFLTGLTPLQWDRLYGVLAPVIPQKMRLNMPGDRAHKLAEIVTASSPEEMYRFLVSHWRHPHLLVPGSHEPATVLTDKSYWPELTDFSERMMFLDAMTYLPDDILVKVDRAAMGVSLETRVPFLDHRLVEFAWCLPLDLKIRNGQEKWILSQVLYKYVPKKMIERPKMGFGVPIDQWLRGPLRDWAENLLDEKRLQEDSFFNAAMIRERWDEHLSGRRNWQYHLWDVLMFQAWNDSQG